MIVFIEGLILGNASGIFSVKASGAKSATASIGTELINVLNGKIAKRIRADYLRDFLYGVVARDEAFL